MKLSTALNNIKTTAKANPAWALFDLFLILFILAVIGFALVLGIYLAPVIASALAFALLPQAMLSLIAFLPLVIGIAALLGFLKNNWLYLDEYSKSPEKLAPDYLLAQSFLAALDPALCLMDSTKSFNYHLNLVLLGYGCLASLAALGLGVYLSVMTLPTLITAVTVSIGLPYALVAVLLGALVVSSAIWTVQQLFVLPLQLANLGFDFLEWKESNYKDWVFHVVQALFTTAGVAMMGYACYFLFPILINSLLPLLPQATATFTAVLICIGLMSLTLKAVSIAVELLGNSMRLIADKGKESEPSAVTLAFKQAEFKVRAWTLYPEEKIDLNEEFKKDYGNSKLFFERLDSSVNEPGQSY